MWRSRKPMPYCVTIAMPLQGSTMYLIGNLTNLWARIRWLCKCSKSVLTSPKAWVNLPYTHGDNLNRKDVEISSLINARIRPLRRRAVHYMQRSEREVRCRHSHTFRSIDSNHVTLTSIDNVQGRFTWRWTEAWENEAEGSRFHGVAAEARTVWTCSTSEREERIGGWFLGCGYVYYSAFFFRAWLDNKINPFLVCIVSSMCYI